MLGQCEIMVVWIWIGCVCLGSLIHCSGGNVAGKSADQYILFACLDVSRRRSLREKSLGPGTGGKDSLPALLLCMYLQREL